MKTTLTLLALCLVFVLSACGLGSADFCQECSIPKPETLTKYRTLYVGPCGIQICGFFEIPPSYAHYAETWQDSEFSVSFGAAKRASIGPHSGRCVTVPCGACEIGLTGMMSVQFDKGQLIPYGCGRQVPPLDIIRAETTIGTADTTPIQFKDQAKWSTKGIQWFEHDYVPELTMSDKICDGDYVLFDLTPSCEVLVKAGLAEKNE